MLKISGLDKLKRELNQIQKALAALDGDIGTVSFDPNNPASIELAIHEVERMIDERVAAYASNPTVQKMAESMKEKYRDGILERAATARVEGITDNDDQ